MKDKFINFHLLLHFSFPSPGTYNCIMGNQTNLLTFQAILNLDNTKTNNILPPQDGLEIKSHSFIQLEIELGIFIIHNFQVFSISQFSIQQEDEDVAAERERITSLPLSQLQQDNMLIVKNLRKVYSLRGRKGNLLAVEDLCLGIPQGECFGLLGELCYVSAGL